ncbi:MAG: hypothetical protein ACJAYG_001790 [Oceanicoccus sp.]|jgi:hypothetical protein
MTTRFFINRRTAGDRRKGREQRHNPRLDLSHRRRRKHDERRDLDRSNSADFYAASKAKQSSSNNPPPIKH